MASEIRYATEENIRTLIELINAKLAEYSTSEGVDKKLKAYLDSSEFKKAVKDIVGDVTPGPTPEDPEDPEEGFPPTYLKYKIDLVLPEKGEPDTLYFIIEPKDDESDDQIVQNRYSEYLWLENEEKYELIGSSGSDEAPSMSYKLEFILPDQGEPNVIYIVPKKADGDNRCDEYIWLEEEERFELIGPSGLSPLSIQKVEELPSFGVGNVIYLLSEEGSLEGIYKAYLWVDKIDEDEDQPMAIDDIEDPLPEAPSLDLGYFDLIGAFGFDPKFATDEDIDPFYDFLIKPNLTKEVTINTSSDEEGDV